MFRIGVISDTHDYLDPRVSELFSGVDHILHGGDIGRPKIIHDLEEIAPVTAVLGNNDIGLETLGFRETETLEMAGKKFLVHHIVTPQLPTASLRERIAKERPDVVVFGHSHIRYCENLRGIMFLNPGYSGRPKLGLHRGVAVLSVEAEGLKTQFYDL